MPERGRGGVGVALDRECIDGEVEPADTHTAIETVAQWRADEEGTRIFVFGRGAGANVAQKIPGHCSGVFVRLARAREHKLIGGCQGEAIGVVLAVAMAACEQRADDCRGGSSCRAAGAIDDVYRKAVHRSRRCGLST
jgi:hypothetical protein